METELLDRAVKYIESKAKTYNEGRTHFTILCEDGSTTMVAKEQVWKAYHTLDLRDTEASYKQRKHEHRGEVQDCWECGRKFCYGCKGYEGNWSEGYCGC
jgi:hypothetical protein